MIREEEITKNNSEETKMISDDKEFVAGWDPTSLGFGAINYQMRKPNIK